MLGVLREIAAWREMTAQKRNKPRGRIIRDEAMVELAASSPKSIKDLERMRGIPEPFITRGDGKQVLALIEKANSLPLEDCPQITKEKSSTAGTSALIEMLRLLLKVKAKAKEYQVASKLIATSADIETIAREADPLVPALQGWRREIFGEDALALKEGKVASGIKNHKVSLIHLS